jgi:hypothetical protein
LTACVWKWGIFVVIRNFVKTDIYLALTAARNGGINPASFCSSCWICTALGWLGFIHLHAWTACIVYPPPPNHLSMKN